MKNYNFLDKILHQIIFIFPSINKFLFTIETFLYHKKNKHFNHIFITGLPRSGTTLILNFIYESNKFFSLKYCDMPFILSPKINSIFRYKKREINPIKRAHGDEIYNDLNSPEAFDEVLINLYKDKKFIQKYKIFIENILNSFNVERYLSKNNLNFMRLEVLSAAFNESFIVIPFRDPIHQSHSLLNQHIKFLNLQKKDKFILRYMNYLRHNEFGLSHECWIKPKLHTDSTTQNYWLEQYYLCYQKILHDIKRLKNKKILLINYDKFAREKQYRNRLENILNIKTKFNNIKYRNQQKLTFCLDKNLVKEATIVYKELIRLSN